MGFVVNADIEKLAFYALFPENRDNETACHLVMSIAVFSRGLWVATESRFLAFKMMSSVALISVIAVFQQPAFGRHRDREPPVSDMARRKFPLPFSIPHLL